MTALEEHSLVLDPAERGDGLPEGWVLASLGDILELKYGRGLVETNRRPGTVPVYGSNGIVGHHDEALTAAPCIIVGRKGSVGAVHLSNTPCWPIDTTYYVDDLRGLDAAYAYFLLRYLSLGQLDTSTAVPGLNRQHAYAQQFPLPSLAEQRRIVAQVEALLARTSAARERLAKARTIIKRFRQAVLAAACSGQLTADWRRNTANRQSACGLLHEIASRPQNDPAATTPLVHLARRRKPHRPVALDSEAVNFEDLASIPDGWAWTTLSAIAELKAGLTKGQKRRPGAVVRSVPYLRVANVQRGYLDLAEVKTIEATEAEIIELRLEPNDILLNEGGDRDKLGRGWIWSGELPECIHQNHVFRARRRFKDIEPKYISWYGNSEGHAYFFSEGRQTVNLASLSLTKLSTLPVKLPPPFEQREIVRRVEALFALADAIERRLQVAAVRADALAQAILARAFRGELVPTEAELARQEGRDYEPAAALLQRVRSCRADAPRAATRGGRAAARQMRLPDAGPTSMPTGDGRTIVASAPH